MLLLECSDDFQNNELYREQPPYSPQPQRWYLSKRRPLYPPVLLFDIRVRFSSCSDHDSLLMTPHYSMYRSPSYLNVHIIRPVSVQLCWIRYHLQCYLTVRSLVSCSTHLLIKHHSSIRSSPGRCSGSLGIGFALATAICNH